MVYELKFADVGEGVAEGEILQWHVKPGEKVKNEQVLVEVMTEKVNVEITAPVAGTIIKLGIEEGGTILVGEILVTINEEDSEIDVQNKSVTSNDLTDSIKNISPQEKDDSLFKPSQDFKRVQPKIIQIKRSNDRVLASPSIRREARERNIDLGDIQGTGPGGRINRSDFENYTQGKPLAPTSPKSTRLYSQGAEERIPLRGLRRVIARSMRHSIDLAAHYTYFEEVDMTSLDAVRKQAKTMGESRGVKVTYLPFIIKALIPALKEFPFMNATLDDEKEEIILKNYYNIGISVDTPKGLMVPVIKNADQKNIWEISADIQDVAERARQGKLKLEDMTGGTFTITSIGNLGGVMATPIINHPEVAILGIMRKKLRPVVIETHGGPEITIRPMLYLCLSLDHRVVDGAIGAHFTNTLIKYMENPGLLLLND